jgi:amino acid adenylation domain-containing protein
MLDCDVLHGFARSIAEDPTRIALEHGPLRLSYGELDRWSDSLARLLADGPPRAVVAVAVSSPVERVVALLGVWKAGCVFAPVDLDLPAAGLARLVAYVEPQWWIEDAWTATDSAPSPFPEQGAPRRCHLDPERRTAIAGGADFAGGGKTVAESPTPLTGIPFGPDDFCYLVPTSGSTGVPKLIAGRYQGVGHFIRWETELLGLGPGTRVSQLTSPYFDAYLRDVFVPLCSGGTLVLPASADIRLDADALAEWLDRAEIALVHCVPSLFHLLATGDLHPRRFALLRAVLLAGERPLTAEIARWFSAFGERVRIVNLYGPSETTMTKLFHEVQKADLDRPSIPIGRPIAGAAVLLVDAADRPSAPGTVGEILLRTPYRSLGYYKAPLETAERFRPNPWSGDPDDLVYRTGDLGRLLPSGELEFLGRRDQQVKIRGQRIELSEVESALLGHPGVRAAAAVPRQDADGLSSLWAFVVLAPETPEVPAAMPHEIRRWLARSLPAQLLPDRIVPVAALPQTRNGKLDRRALAKLDAAGRGTAPRVPPRTPTESRLTEIWEEVIGVRESGVEDDFFTVGGHSLLATRLLLKARAAFGVELPLRAFLDRPTIAALAGQIEEQIAERVNPQLPLAADLGSAPQAIPRLGGRTDLPLSYAQERLWFLEQLDPGLPVYNIPFAVRLRGRLDRAALERALGGVVARHEVLRTRFRDLGGRPVQTVTEIAEPGVPLPLVDLRRGGGGTAREDAARRLAESEAGWAFDLRQGPLLRARLLWLEDEEHLLLLTLHHIAGDAWSLGVLLAELAALYTGESMASLPIQYADYAAWQRGSFGAEELSRQMEYWRRQLTGVPVLQLPTDRRRPAAPSQRGGQVPIELSLPLAESLRQLGRETGTTLFMVLLAGFEVVLARYSGQDDFAVGTAVAHRDRREILGSIGFFVNVLALRASVAGAPTFRALLGGVREVTLGAYAHQDLPFERLVEELRPARDTGTPPLVQITFQLQNAPFPVLRVPGLELAAVPVADGTAKFDLGASLAEQPQGLSGHVEYSTDLFERATAARFAGHLRRLYEAAVADPEGRLAELPLLDSAERRQVLQEWNRTAADWGPVRLAHELFEAQARRTPDTVAVLADAGAIGERCLSYGELDRQADRLARRLRTLGVGPEVRVGLCLGRGPELLVGVFGVLKAGGAYVPLDPAYPPDRLALMIADAAPRVVLAAEEHREVTRGASDAGHAGDAAGAPVLLVEAGRPPAGTGAAEREPPAVAASLENAAYVIYTSGSTGRPKGVVVPHRGLFHSIHDDGERWLGRQPRRVLQASSPSFDASVSEFFHALAWGGTLVHGKPGSDLPGPELLRLLRDQEVEVATFVPSVLAQLDPAAFPGLAVVLASSEALPAELVRRWAPGRRLWNAYGPTECTIGSTTSACSPEKLPPPIGVPIRNAQAYVLEPAFCPAPVGVPGELYIGGQGVTRGYLGRPALTAERFVPDPWGPPGTRLYRTGDRVRWRTDGEIEFLGRVDHQIQLRGFRIEPGEVEAALRQAPGVRDAVVILREDAPGDPRLVAYVVHAVDTVDPGPSLPSGRALRDHLARRLPGHLVPSVVVVLSALPLLPNGKLDRRALPIPGAALGEGGVFVAPRSPLEEILAGIWAEVLGEGGIFVAPRSPLEEILAGIWAEVLGAERVSVEDDFFTDLGGHSLLATQVIARLRDRAGIELPLRSLFEAPTIRRWAALAEAPARLAAPREGEIRRRASPRETAATAPLSFTQERLWLVEQLTPGLPTYNLPLGVRVAGRLDVPALGRALRALVARHEALRTRFGEAENGPVQVIAEILEVVPPLPVLDLAGVGDRSRGEREAERLATEEAGRPFDLRRGPLLRARLLRLGEEEHLLLLTLHHIVSDGWSLGVLVAELGALYTGEPLPELPIQYADYAVWQREQLSGEALNRQLAHWRRTLDGAPALEFPADRRRTATPSHRGGRVPIALAGERTAALRRLGREAGATLFMTLFAGFTAILARYAGEDDGSVGTVVANRPRRELEGLIGFFVNTLVLRVDLSGEPSFGAFLKRVRGVTLDAYAHQDLPFERLVEELRPARDGSQPPLVRALFVLQNTPLSRLDLPGLALTPVETGNGMAKFDLSALLSEEEDGVAGVLEYAADLFEPATVERLAGHLLRLLEAAAADPGGRVGELPMLAEEERRQLLAGAVAGNGAAIDQDRPAHELFAARAGRAPDTVAILSGERVWSYGELNRRANRLAHLLRARGVGPEVRVGLGLERGPDFLVALLAVLKAGGVYVPLDPLYPRERLAFMLADAAPWVVLVAERHRHVFAAGGALATGAPVLALDGEEAGALAGLPDGDPPPLAGPGNGAYVIYTSGSTGRPKGALIEHRSLSHLLHAMARRWDFEQPRRVLLFSSPSFDASVGEMWAALPWGGALVHGSRDQLLPAPELATLVREQAVDMAILPPSLLARLDPADFPGLETLIAAGEACPGEVAARWSPGRRMWNGYGPTECTVFSTTAPCAILPPPIGRPLAGVRTHVLERGLELSPVGMPGELYIGGPGLARGYLNRPERTAERFVPDPFGGFGLRLYRTGDRVRLRVDGEIEYLGRLDHQVKLRGFRIELGEIESVLGESLAVREAGVVLREDTPGEPRLVAYVVPPGDTVPTAAELRLHCERRLPEPMVPAVFVVLDALPLSPNGKIDRRRLPAPVAPTGFVPPGNPLEEVLAGVWAEVLGLDRVSVTDDFFADLGGHSLLATQVVTRVRALLGRNLPLRSLFDASTVRDWATAVEGLAGEGSEDLPESGIRRRAQTTAPLSFAQERLWFLEQLTPGLAVYNVPQAVRLLGRLDPAALGCALVALAVRHEVLRTRFLDAAGAPRQEVVAAADIALALPAIDLSGVADREAEAARLTVVEAALPFDLRRAPLVRALLLRLAAEEHLLLLTFHHIVSDGWSLGVALGELGALYTGEPLPELPIQYADYAVWQREHFDGAVLARQLGYWRERLAGLPALQLPADRPRPAVRGDRRHRSHRGGWVRVELPADLANALRRRGRDAGATLFMTLLAGFAVVLARYSGQEDVPVGTAVANRRRRELEGLIGFFVNTLVLRTDLTGRPGFGGLLAQVRETTLGAYGHQDLPFERLVEAMRPARDTGQNPLVQVMLILQNTPLPKLLLPGLALLGVAIPSRTAKLDLTLSLAEQEDGAIAGTLEHDADLFEEATAVRFAGHLRRLLATAVESPETPVGELPLLDEEERRQLLLDWNRTAVDWGLPGCVHDLFTAQAERTPEATALIASELRLSYAEVERRSALLARRLERMGVGPESLVGVCLPRSADLVIALLGVLRAGGAYVPLDPALPAARLLEMGGDSGLRAVVIEAALMPAVADLQVPMLTLADAPEVTDGALLAPAANPANPANAVYAIYTSGSTGLPKGVVNTHGGVVNRLLWMQVAYGLGSADRVLQKTPFSFDVSVWELFWPLAVGAALVIAQPEGHRDPEYLVELIEAERVTVLHFVPSMLAAFLAARGMARAPALRQVFASGEALSEDLRRRFFAQSQAELHNLYGPTEAAVDVTAWRAAPDDRPRGATVPIGRPIANTRIYVLDEAGEPAPVGVPGELHIGGIGLARGYLGRAGLTAERFVPDPFDVSGGGRGGGRLYRTGDRARVRAGGEIEFLGRLDHQVKLRGFRVEPGEIEAVLTASPEVGEAVVALREDLPGDFRLVAYVTPAGDSGPDVVDVAGLRHLCRERLPVYMVPAAFVVLPRLPLLPNGKLDRRALPAPEEIGGEPAEGFVAPASPLEEILAGLWAEVLGRERVSATAGFFTELGGHSLLATQVVSRLRERLGIDLPLRSLFDAPTVRAWAELARARSLSPSPALSPGGFGEPIRRRARTGELPLSYAQERLWFLEQLMPGLAVYNLPLAVRLIGRLDRSALRGALAAIVERHEVLRTGFRSEEGRPVQVIAPARERPPGLPLVDLTGVGKPVVEADRLASEEARRLFDLRRGPLLRGLLLRLREDEHLLLLTLHHIASDGWSLGVLVRELSALYAGESLPELPIQVADCAAWQRDWLDREVLAAQLAYWRRQLAGVPVLDLPTDRPRPAVSRHRGAEVRVLLPGDLAGALRRRSREAGVTLFMTLLAGFAAVLARYSGQEDLPVGTAVANRRRRELEGLIGFFVNTLALRVDLAGGPSFGELLARVREMALGAYEHQDLPFEKLVAELRPVRDTSHEPLVQVSFLLQNAPMPDVDLPGLALTAEPAASRTAKLDLLVSMSEHAGGTAGIAATWEYDTDLFDAATIERMAGHLRRLLEAALAETATEEAPGFPWSRLPLFDAAERRELLDLGNGAAAPLPDLPVHALFEAQVEKTPDAVAVVSRARSLTYRELDRRANGLAHRLREEGVDTDARVGLRLERGPDLVLGILSVLKAGGAYVPLDPTYPAERLAGMIADASPRQVIADLHGCDLVPRLAPPPYSLPASAAYVLFTSGSTGRPKGVALPHRALHNLIAWQLRETPRPARTLQLAPVSFDVSFQELLTTLGGGGTLVLLDEETRRDPPALLRLLDRERVERLFLPMTALQQLAQAWPKSSSTSAAGLAASALTTILAAGERLQLTAEVVAMLGALPGCTLYNQYGPTESHVVTSKALFGDVASWPSWPSIGRPVANVPVLLLDGEMEPVPVGVPGEIHIGGIALARGYLGRPALTAERFVPDPFDVSGEGGRLYRTGDRARLRADGEIEYLGRLDQQVKLRGYRIEPGEIEAVLAGSPGVRQAAVTVREDRPGDPRLVAYVVPEEGEPEPITIPDLRRRCQDFLPAFMVPSAFVVLPQLPLLPSGKLDRRTLPAPEAARPELAAPFVGPESQLERAVAEVWKEVLEVDRVGLHDNFFDLGGHSLLAVRLHGRLLARLGRDCSVIDVFRYPTVASFARFLAEPASGEAAPLPEEKSERLVAGRGRLAEQQAARRAASRRKAS